MLARSFTIVPEATFLESAAGYEPGTPAAAGAGIVGAAAIEDGPWFASAGIAAAAAGAQAPAVLRGRARLVVARRGRPPERSPMFHRHPESPAELAGPLPRPEFGPPTAGRQDS